MRFFAESYPPQMPPVNVLPEPEAKAEELAEDKAQQLSEDKAQAGPRRKRVKTRAA